MSKSLELSPTLSLQNPEAITAALNGMLADIFALYLKTKNFHWHMSGTYFRDYHLLLDDYARHLHASPDEGAERVRKIGFTPIRSIGHISRLQSIPDNDSEQLSPAEMLRDLLAGEGTLLGSLRSAHELCSQSGDVATASLIENWIDACERRLWFLRQTLAA